jgi:hypothetical protein
MSKEQEPAPFTIEHYEALGKPVPLSGTTAVEWTVATPSGIWQGDEFLAYARNKRDAEKIVAAHTAAITAAITAERERNSWSQVVSPLQHELAQLREQLAVLKRDYVQIVER